MTTLKRFFIISVLALCSASAWGYGEVRSANNNLRDVESLQRGAQLFFENCVGCHSLEYARFNRVARDLNIPEDLFVQLLLDADRPIGDLMTNALSPALGKQFFGTMPPDLTLISRVRDPDWIYSLLTGFYVDPMRPYGVNNSLYPNIGMPHVLVNQQGLCAEAPGPDGCQQFVSTGTLSPVAFDLAMVDLTNFLDYVGEPIRVQRERMGWFVLSFLSVFLVFAWLLYRELWKDVK